MTTIRHCLGLAFFLLGFHADAAIAQDSLPQHHTREYSATSDLYISKRPAPPRLPRLPGQLQKKLATAEAGVSQKRNEAIELLRDYLSSTPTGDSRSEGIFKLAELLWEDARSQYFSAMDVYSHAMEICRQNQQDCKTPPKEPRLNLEKSETLYRTLLRDQPDFRRIDLVLYLIGFAAQEDDRNEEALVFFSRVVQEHPTSPLFGDAWLMVGEHHFTAGEWNRARTAYKEVLKRPTSESYDLALFKTAWCDWKLGDTTQAAKRFKLVLDLAAEAEKSGTDREIKRRSQLRDEALDYLVLVFTEDPSIRADDVYQFLASIGGERYSKSIVVRLADVFYSQAEYRRAVEAYRFLINNDPNGIASANYQKNIVNSYFDSANHVQVIAELRILVETYKPESEWAKKNQSHTNMIQGTYKSIEKLVRGMAKNLHAEAQTLEKTQGVADKKQYQRAIDLYELYLATLGDDAHAVEIHYRLAEILLFKLEQLEAAGDEYLAVGKSSPVGEWHKDALEKAMFAFRKARPTLQDRPSELLPIDRKFAESTDLFATLFPASEKIVGIIYENGQLFYDYQDYDEAIKRFGLIVTEYPNHPTAGPAGDRILDALNKGEDYENIENWARKLRKAKSFQPPEQRSRLDRLIVESIGKSGEKYAESGDYVKAASFYLRVSKEFPDHELAPQSTFNAAVLLEKAQKPEQAAGTYLRVAKAYPRNSIAPKAAFTAATVYESMAYFEKAAEVYELTSDSFRSSEQGANALFNAGVLRQALGHNKQAIKHYENYAKRFRKTRKDAPEVAFRVAVVYQLSGDLGRAERAYNSYLKNHKGGVHQLEAMVFAGRSAYQLGQYKRAEKQLAAAQKLFKKFTREKSIRNRPFAAEARYYQGELLYRRYYNVSLDVKPRKLNRTLATKMKLLDQASAIYLDVVKLNDASWATAALYRIGSVMEEFADSLRAAPIPAGFSEDDADQYREELNNRVITIEEKAIDLYSVGYKKAIELKVYNQFTQKLRTALGRMAASQFPPLKEARSSRRIGDRTPAIELTTEVYRGE